MCGTCNRAFNQKNALQTHLIVHSTEKPFSCSLCNLSFTQKGNLKTHIRRVHKMEVIPESEVTAIVSQPVVTIQPMASEEEASTSEKDNAVSSKCSRTSL